MGRNKSAKLNIVTAVLLLLVLPVLWLAGAFVLPAQYDDTFLGELKYKEERLRRTEGKRLVLVGGSALAFGVDSALLSDAFPEYEIVNMGMYAALGTTVMFDLTARELREGDIVVVVPEQDPQTLSDYFNAEMMWQAVDGASWLLTNLPREKLGQMVGELPYFASEKWKNFLTGTVMTPDAVYARANFNVYGDLDCAAADRNIMPDQYDTGKAIYFDTDVIDDAFVTALNEYVREAQENGAQVWYHFPPMNARAVLLEKKAENPASDAASMDHKVDARAQKQEEDAVDDYYGYLCGVLDCEIAGDPHDAVMDAGWFYDTNFHLNQSGRIVYTAQLIRDLKAMMGVTAATEVALLQMPVAQAAETMMNGDERDSDYFLYNEKDGGVSWSIIGVTEEGKTKKELTVPTKKDRLPVVEIAVDALCDLPVTEQITLHQNIRSLPNGMFAGCDSLQRIRLQGAKPTEVLVSEGLLEGATENIRIVVDEDQVTAFKTNYSWSAYRDKIQGE